MLGNDGSWLAPSLAAVVDKIMDERVLRFRVGVVVVAAAIITIILITLLGAWPSPFKERNTFDIRFSEAPGVTVDTPVRKSGIQIGRVSKVELGDDGDVWLKLQIDAEYKIRKNEICRISTGSFVTGDAILEFVRSHDPTLSSEAWLTGAFLPRGEVESDPFQELAGLKTELAPTFKAIEGAGNEVQKLAQNINAILGTEDRTQKLSDVVENANKALLSFDTAMVSINQILGDDEMKGNLRDSLAQVPSLFAEAQKTLTEVQKTLNEFSAVAARAERNLANMEDFTAPLGERGEEISQKLLASISNFNELLANFKELSQVLKNKDGTIGQLITNPELYDRVNRMLAELEQAIRKIQPILNDVRVITSKVATDPAQMGVKGILDRRPIGAGLKYPVYPSTGRAHGNRVSDRDPASPLR